MMQHGPPVPTHALVPTMAGTIARKRVYAGIPPHSYFMADGAPRRGAEDRPPGHVRHMEPRRHSRSGQLARELRRTIRELPESRMEAAAIARAERALRRAKREGR